MTRLRSLVAASCALLVVLTAVPALSGAATLTTIRVGRASPESFLFALLDVGVAAHIWERVGLNLDMSAFKSDSQQQQAFVAGQLDFAIGSGPSMGYRAKGVPAIAVAEMYGSPANMCVVVSDNGPVKSVSDLKGKTVTVSSSGSLTDWLVHETSREQGWGNDGITSLGMGEVQPRIIAMNNGQTGHRRRPERRLPAGGHPPGPRLDVVRLHQELHHPRDLRQRRDGGQPSGYRAALPARLVHDGRLRQGAQAGNGGRRRGRAAPDAGGDREALRR
jgi:hypothetical protein